MTNKTAMLSNKFDRYESEFSYQPMMRKPNMKTYISSELQNELREVTENHIFKSKVIGFNQPSEQAILKAKANRSQKAHSSIVSEQ